MPCLSGVDYGLFGKSLEQVSPEELDRFLAQRVDEGQRVEYKQTLVDGLKLARSISALANAEGGLIVFGVGTRGTKPTSFAGMTTSPSVEDTILNWVSAHLRPRPRLEVRQIPKLNEVDKSYLLVRVPWSDNTPCEVVRWSDGEPLIPIRIGSDIRRASASEIAVLMGRRLSPEKERDLVDSTIRGFPFIDLKPPGSQSQVPTFHFFFVPLADRTLIEMTREADFEIAEAAQFFGPFIEIAHDAFIRKRLFGVRTEPTIPGARYAQDAVELRQADYEHEPPRATCVKVSSTGGIYVGGLLGTDVVLFHRLIGYVLGSIHLAKWLLDKGAHFGKVFVRVNLLDVGNRVLDFGFGRSATIQVDGGCRVDRSTTYERLEEPVLVSTEISRRLLREFQIAVSDERLRGFITPYENQPQLT